MVIFLNKCLNAYDNEKENSSLSDCIDHQNARAIITFLSIYTQSCSLLYETRVWDKPMSGEWKAMLTSNTHSTLPGRSLSDV